MHTSCSALYGIPVRCYICDTLFEDLVGTMYVWGTANPVGEGNGYDGMYLTGGEMNAMCLDKALIGLPVKVEHKGDTVGSIVSAWQHNGCLDLLLDITDNSPDMASHLASHYVKGNVCKDLSLGYTVCVEQSVNGALSTGNKRVAEVSLVKQGARQNCHIHGFFGV
jgi:hypothetical protein